MLPRRVRAAAWSRLSGITALILRRRSSVADHTGRVGAVRDHRIRPGPRPASPVPGHVDLGEQLGEHRSVVALPSGDDHRHRPAVPIDGLMGRRQPAAGAADAMPGQILLIRSRPLCPARGGSCSSRADTHAQSSHPPTLPSRSSRRHRPRQESASARDPRCRPPCIAAVPSHRLPRPEKLARQIPPPGPGRNQSAIPSTTRR